MRKKSVYVLSALLAIALVGCGGTSGSKDKSDDHQIQISGVAVDDVIVNGDVVAFPVGKSDEILARGKTDNQGNYSFKVSHEGVVVVKVTCGDEGKMLDPETNKTQQCEQNLALRSAASVSKESDDVKINISPVSELLVSHMENKLGSSKDAVSAFKEAREEVGQVFDVDPVKENPLQNRKYKQTVKSFRKLADTKHTTLKEVIDDLNDDLSDGVTGDDNSVAVDLANVMIDEGFVSTLTQKKGKVKVQIPEKDTNPNPKPQPKPVSPEEQLKADIKASKAFFDDLRTQAMSVVDYNQSGTPGFLDIEAEKLGKTLEDVSLNANIAGEYSVKIIDAIIHAIDENKTNAGKFFDSDDESRRYEIDKDDDTHWNYTIFYNEGKVAEGTITLPTKNPKSITPGNFTTLHTRVDGNLPKKSAYQTGEKTQHVSLDATITKTDSGATLEVSKLSLSDENTSTALKNLKGKVGYTYDKTKPEDEQVGMKFIEFDSGMMESKVPGYEINGSIVIPEYVINNGIQGKGFIEEKYTTYMHGSMQCFNDQNQTASRATVIYTDKNGEAHSLIALRTGNDLQFFKDFKGNIAGLDHDGVYSWLSYGGMNNVKKQLDEHNISMEVQGCYNPVFNWLDIELDSDENFYNSGKLPKKVLFEGTIVNTKTKSQLSGKLSVDWLNAATFDFNAENPFPHVDVTYAGMLKRAGYKDMTLMLGYKNETERNLFSFSYAYDATSINGTGDFDKEMKNGLVRLNSHNGIEAKIAVKDGDVVYGSKSSVTKDNRKIGELQDRKDVPVIKYEDGTFESLP